MHNKKRSFSIFMVTALVLLFAVNAFAEKGGECVTYVMNQKPGGYVWRKQYPVKKNGQPTSTKIGWGPAKEIWTRLWVESRGSDARKNSVLVLDSWKEERDSKGNVTRKGNSSGHVAIVTKVDGNKYYVRHSNWDGTHIVSTGYYTKVGGGKVTYTTSNDVKWKTPYVLLGFIYKP